jgi:hypothetical protein
MRHIRELVDGEIVWAPAISGAFVLTTRGGDFALHIGEDVSIGYLGHDDNKVRLYLQETFTFLLLTTEASVALNANDGKAKPRSAACRRHHHKFLPSITVTGTASRSKSSNRCKLTATRGLSKSGLPVDQSGDSEYVPHPQLAQKWCFTVRLPH